MVVAGLSCCAVACSLLGEEALADVVGDMILGDNAVRGIAALAVRAGITRVKARRVAIVLSFFD